MTGQSDDSIDRLMQLTIIMWQGMITDAGQLSWLEMIRPENYQYSEHACRH